MNKAGVSAALLIVAGVLLLGGGGRSGSCNCGPRRNITQTSPLPQYPVSGPAVWTIAGRSYEIESTYLIVFKDGEVQYTINYLGPADLDPHGLSHDQALDLVLPLMIYAFDQGLYQSAKVSKLGRQGKPLAVSRIGVAIIKKKVTGTEGIASVSESGGYRVALSLDEDRDRKGPADPSVPAQPSPGK